MEKLRVLNVFGITPTKSFTAAGYDFYIPKFENVDENKTDIILDAFSKSYKIEKYKLNKILDLLGTYVSAVHGENVWTNDNALNILHLFLSLKSNLAINFNEEIDDVISCFVDDKLTFDVYGTPGVICFSGDYFLFNSGIKNKMEPNRAGIFFNKSGKGNQGFDVRACVVDEDYTGFIHMSVEYDNCVEDQTIYCGDKLLQYIILELPKTEIELVDEDEFDRLHKDSIRGVNGFGSSDVAH